jgi:hypothetical protein
MLAHGSIATKYVRELTGLPAAAAK